MYHQMGTSQTFLVLCFIILHVAIASETCKSISWCAGILSPWIRFPFRTQSQPQRCGYPGFELSCDDRNQTLISTQSGEIFNVTSIDYQEQNFQVNDPGNCMPGRHLMGLAVDFPFQLDSRFERNFTFLNCTPDVTSVYLTPYPCLSGSGYTVNAVSTDDYGLLRVNLTCRFIKTVVVPMDYPYRFGSSLYFDVLVSWAEPDCGACASKYESCGFKARSGLEVKCFDPEASGRGLPVGAKFGIMLGAGVGGLVIMLGLALRFSGRGGLRPNTGATTSVAPRPVVSTGLSRSTIELCPKLVFGDSVLSEALPDSSDDINHACPICLCEYKPNDEIRMIEDCKHYFHVHCIDEWLQINATCPLCNRKIKLNSSESNC